MRIAHHESWEASASPPHIHRPTNKIESASMVLKVLNVIKDSVHDPSVWLRLRLMYELLLNDLPFSSLLVMLIDVVPSLIVQL